MKMKLLAVMALLSAVTGLDIEETAEERVVVSSTTTRKERKAVSDFDGDYTMKLRLVPVDEERDSSGRSGRVEVDMGDGNWGTICGNTHTYNRHFGKEEAKVICRTLGLPSDNAEPILDVPSGTGDVLLASVYCLDYEPHLAQCKFNYKYSRTNYQCKNRDGSHKADVGVYC